MFSAALARAHLRSRRVPLPPRQVDAAVMRTQRIIAYQQHLAQSKARTAKAAAALFWNAKHQLA